VSDPTAPEPAEIPSDGVAPLPHAVGRLLDPLRLTIRSGLKRLPAPLAEFILFGLKQAWASAFAGLMLGLLIITKYVWHADWPIHRYDALFIAAVAIQIAFLALRLESFDEAKVIFVYHVVGTVMEIFKTHMGSWSYPEEAIIRIGGVPLFTGFMYASVGSYMARVMRICDMRFEHYPKRMWTFALAIAIYLNFFDHHFGPDLRYGLFALTGMLFWRTTIHYRLDVTWHRMPYLLAAFLTAIFLWIAENIGTYTGTWLYPHQSAWQMVGMAKLGSWFLLLVVSFVLVALVSPPRAPDGEA
jgi:uncharacterized membrane protein YoaT (DUF817 family)